MHTSQSQVLKYKPILCDSNYMYTASQQHLHLPTFAPAPPHYQPSTNRPCKRQSASAISSLSLSAALMKERRL